MRVWSSSSTAQKPSTHTHTYTRETSPHTAILRRFVWYALYLQSQHSTLCARPALHSKAAPHKRLNGDSGCGQPLLPLQPPSQLAPLDSTQQLGPSPATLHRPRCSVVQATSAGHSPSRTPHACSGLDSYRGSNTSDESSGDVRAVTTLQCQCSGGLGMVSMLCPHPLLVCIPLALDAALDGQIPAQANTRTYIHTHTHTYTHARAQTRACVSAQAYPWSRALGSEHTAASFL